MGRRVAATGSLIDAVAELEGGPRTLRPLPLDDVIPVNREIIQAETGMRAVFGPTMLRKAADFGNILLSRHPIEQVRRYDITFRSREPRGIIEALVRLGDRTVRVCVTHFGLRAWERVSQARRLARVLFCSPAPAFRVAMGDLNDWLPGSPFIRPLLSRFPSMASPRSFPSIFPLLALDRVLVRGKGGERVSVTAHRSPAARVASDHLPVVADVDLSECI